MNILAIIPARTGSKRIKNKNFIKIVCKRLIDYTVDSALACSTPMRKIISTNDPNLLRKFIKKKIDFPFTRPKKLSCDRASTFSVVKHALLRMEAIDKKKYQLCLLLQPTCPMRTSTMIDSAVRIMKLHPRADSLISVVNVGANHPFRMYRLTKKGLLKPFCTGVTDPMLSRQLLPPIYIRSGDIYLTKRSTILNQKSLIGKRPMALIISPEKTINIDEPRDLFLAKILLQKRKCKK